MVAPPALKAGDVIGIAAPSSPFDRAAFDHGVAWLEDQGFRPKFRDDIHARFHYLAGSRRRRLTEIEALWRSPEVKALFFARGGFGVMHLLPDLALDPIIERPIVLLGFSDLTPLLNWVTDKAGLITFHGPLVAGFHSTSDDSLSQMLAMVTGAGNVPGPIASRHGVKGVLSGGRATGVLCGGNLSLVASTLGTPFELDTRGRILFLEEVGERPYRIDRALTQLRLAGKLHDAAGVVFGEMVRCEDPGGGGRPIVDLLEEVADVASGPVVHGLPIGHGYRNLTVPVGAPAILDGFRGTLRFLEPVVS